MPGRTVGLVQYMTCVTCRAVDTGMEVEDITQPALTIEDEVRRVDGFKMSAKLRGLDFMVTKQKLLKVCWNKKSVDYLNSWSVPVNQVSMIS